MCRAKYINGKPDHENLNSSYFDFDLSNLLFIYFSLDNWYDMAIKMIGGIYCPLSPRDPQHRLQCTSTTNLIVILFLFIG